MDLEWRSLSDAERERQYSQSSCIGGDYMPYLRAYADHSATARPHERTMTARPIRTESVLHIFCSPEGRSVVETRGRIAS